MRILLINVPHTAIGSRIPDDHLPPLGLLAIGGPLIDAGHEVRLLDGEFGPMSVAGMVEQATLFAPDALLFGHSGSTSAHPVIARVASALARALPNAAIIYGGVFPTYHWRDILAAEPYVTAIVRGEGEETTKRLIAALAAREPLASVPGIAYAGASGPVVTEPAPIIEDLDAYRVGWELIDHARYSYWGGLRAVVVQFSRGCPHQCDYCGQRGFWRRWRHRDPVRFAHELAELHRRHGVRVINFADENPTSSRRVWRAFLEALIAENVDLILVGSTRADDIVRDADLLPLYKRAGWQRFLLGLEHTDETTLGRIAKGADTATDRQAIRLLRQNGILSMVTWVTGFADERDRDFWHGLRRLLSYDPDQIQTLFFTPHRWTPAFGAAAQRTVIQGDRRRWDYKHQVLDNPHVPPWRVLMWIKLIEVTLQARPKALWRVLCHPDRGLRHAMRWYSEIGRRVWFHEIGAFLFGRRLKHGPTLAAFWGEQQSD
ncbi:MAG TPA: magnesium-protoporphyrin IX monomethyl ester anaerobic oxidative cyclase [Magnetospirillum sp.]|nr:magnesium-protoporphyrin IX monomethyl ester anaerobic oxidative cyclase [Magnetospirillum sp.]